MDATYILPNCNLRNNRHLWLKILTIKSTIINLHCRVTFICHHYLNLTWNPIQHKSLFHLPRSNSSLFILFLFLYFSSVSFCDTVLTKGDRLVDSCPSSDSFYQLSHSYSHLPLFLVNSSHHFQWFGIIQCDTQMVHICLLYGFCCFQWPIWKLIVFTS